MMIKKNNMKVIFNIARTEFRLLFYSPIAWLLLLCFTIQSGMIFTHLLEPLVYSMHDYQVARRASQTLFTASNLTLWNQIVDYLYFYIPLLTMGCMSRDLGGGAMKLFYSSPVSNFQIVMGKYLSLVYYALVLMGVLAVYVLISWCTIEHFEAGWIWMGWLGLFLLTCTYMAIGLFMSSLTRYQILSAMGTFVMFLLLSMVKGWGQEYELMREITYWLSMDGRVYTFIQGLLCSEDVIYFLTIIALFLSLTIIRLHAVRQKQNWYITLTKNVCLLLTLCLVAYISSRPIFLTYYDATSTKKNTLTPNSQEIVKNIQGDMTITAYVNILSPWYSMFRYPNFILENERFFRQYTRFKPETKIKTIYYYAETDPDSLAVDPEGKRAWAKARLRCEIYGCGSTILKNKGEIDALVDLSNEGYSFVRQIVLEDGKKEWLRIYNRGFGKFPGEAEVSVAMKRMIIPLPKLGYVVGHGERSIKREELQSLYYVIGDKTCKFSIENQGFDIMELSLDKKIGEDIDVLMIADPRVTFSDKEEQVLLDYVNRGGNVFILGEPSRRDLLNPMLLRLFGIELTPLLVQNDVKFKSLRPNVLAAMPTANGKNLMYDLQRTYTLSMPTCAGIEVLGQNSFDTLSFVKTSYFSPAWTELETTDFIDDTVVYNPAKGEICKAFTTVLGLSRKINGKEQRILISGDADVLSNNEFIERRNVSSMNETLMLGAAHWLSYGKVPIDVRRPDTTDNKMFITLGWYKVLVWMLHGILPVLILLGYVFLWLRRRSR